MKSVTRSCMPNRFFVILWVKLARKSGPNYEKWSFFCVFVRLSPFSACFWAGKWVTYVRIANNNKSIICSCVGNCFYFILWTRLTGMSVQSYEKRPFLSVFSRLGLFPQVFGQVNEWPISKLHEMIRVLHLFACPIISILFDDPDLFFILWVGLAGRSVHTYKKWSFFSIF